MIDQTDTNRLDADSVASVAPFLSQGFLDRFARNLFAEKSSLCAIVAIAPFVSTSVLDEIAAEAVEPIRRLGTAGVHRPFSQRLFAGPYGRHSV